MSVSDLKLFIPNPEGKYRGLKSKSWAALGETFAPSFRQPKTDTTPAIPSAERSLKDTRFGYVKEPELTEYLATRDPTTVVFIDCRSASEYEQMRTNYPCFQNIAINDNNGGAWETILCLEKKDDEAEDGTPKRDLKALELAAQKGENTVVFFCTGGNARSPTCAAWYYKNYVQNGTGTVDKSKQVVVVMYEGVAMVKEAIQNLKKKDWELKIPKAESVWS